MKQALNLLFFILIFVAIQGCNTLYNSRTIKLEVAVPGKISLPTNYKKIAVRYNNCNIDQNTAFTHYVQDDEMLLDSSKTDSLASKVYFDLFVKNIKKHNFFDSIIELEPANYTGVELIDSLIKPIVLESDTLLINDRHISETIVSLFAIFLKSNQIQVPNSNKKKLIDPEFGLYSKSEIHKIADSTNAELLLSLDYYNSFDAIRFSKIINLGIESVFPAVFWTVYDLQNEKLEFYVNKIDTILWDTPAVSFKHTKRLLPPRKEAILNAADVAGTSFSEFVSPHWVEVERMYYRTGQVDIKKTNQLIIAGKWMEAAEIWKANVNNPNKSIAAKCMFNMGLACEMEGKYKAAIEWVVQSIYLLEQKNEIHNYNCQTYIRILSQRMLDMRNLDIQLNPNKSEVILKPNNFYSNSNITTDLAGN
ncbi:MAG: hypothetical protein HQ522_03730 [Bacteroidetes bacterium]|nr:hypothetical protein [Bacteroidota bacterium]